MLCSALALCAMMTTWFSERGFDPPHTEALMTYIEHESGFDPNVIVRTGVCLGQWAGQRRRTALAAGHGKCPPVEWQLAQIQKELWTVDAYRCFWKATNYKAALRALRRGFGRGHC
jgi:hypothetical protein